MIKVYNEIEEFYAALCPDLTTYKGIPRCEKENTLCTYASSLLILVLSRNKHIKLIGCNRLEQLTEEEVKQLRKFPTHHWAHGLTPKST